MSTSTEAAETLHLIWKLHLSRVGNRGELPAEISQLARASYAAAHADDQRAAFWAYQRKGVQLADDAPPTPIAARFQIGEHAAPVLVVDGWDYGATWNGWRVPLVERSQVEKMIAAMGSDLDEQTRYQLVGGLLVVTDLADDDGSYHVEPVAIVCADGILRELFDIGLGLCWDLVDAAEQT